MICKPGSLNILHTVRRDSTCHKMILSAHTPPMSSTQCNLVKIPIANQKQNESLCLMSSQTISCILFQWWNCLTWKHNHPLSHAKLEVLGWMAYCFWCFWLTTYPCDVSLSQSFIIWSRNLTVHFQIITFNH